MLKVQKVEMKGLGAYGLRYLSSSLQDKLFKISTQNHYIIFENLFAEEFQISILKHFWLHIKSAMKITQKVKS